MTRITSMDLAPFLRTTIGMDQVFNRIVQQIDTSASQTYPPYNIIKTGENNMEVQLAVAGFSQKDIEVKVHENTLIIAGEKQPEVWPDTYEYVYQGIGSRRFMRSFPMGEDCEVLGAELKDGILTVKLERIIPESKKPKSIAITYVS